MIKITVWNEFVHEKEVEKIKEIYPNGIHECIADFLKCEDTLVRTATLDMPEHGLTDDVLNDTDVLIWWGHCAHSKVSDEVAEKVHNAVLKGMGFIALHSAHKSKPLMKMLGTTCNLLWREEDDKEILWCTNPSHPIAQGVPLSFELPIEEMYGEFFDIPKPDDVIYTGWFSGGEVFRSGCTFTRGYGKIFYFQPGHESNPTYYNENVQKVIKNAVYWATPSVKLDKLDCYKAEKSVK